MGVSVFGSSRDLIMMVTKCTVVTVTVTVIVTVNTLHYTRPLLRCVPLKGVACGSWKESITRWTISYRFYKEK